MLITTEETYLSSPKIPQQIISLVILFALAIAALIVARILLIPKTFGEYGHYRASAVDEIMSLPINYSGSQACTECHDDIYALKATSKHKGLACEVCHDAAIKHVDDMHADNPTGIFPTAPRERVGCPLCHGYNPSRPTGFPQIQTAIHNPGKPCMTCHSPHNPTLPHTPEDCSACHAEIASEKGVSPHALLPCITCHVVPPDHLVNPRSALAQKPAAREFCGQCHAPEADSPPEIPRIDFATHNPRYLCWDCHYPHHPEAQ